MVATLLKLTFGFLLVVIGANAINASAASVATPNSAASLEVQVVTADDMKPASCAGIVLTQWSPGRAPSPAPVASELITGSAAIDTIDGLGGDDCILAGDSDDSLTGGAGTDVCLSGAGADTFATCETQTQ